MHLAPFSQPLSFPFPFPWQSVWSSPPQFLPSWCPCPCHLSCLPSYFSWPVLSCHHSSFLVSSSYPTWGVFLRQGYDTMYNINYTPVFGEILVTTCYITTLCNHKPPILRLAIWSVAFCTTGLTLGGTRRTTGAGWRGRLLLLLLRILACLACFGFFALLGLLFLLIFGSLFWFIVIPISCRKKRRSHIILFCFFSILVPNKILACFLGTSFFYGTILQSHKNQFRISLYNISQLLQGSWALWVIIRYIFQNGVMTKSLLWNLNWN